MDAGTPIINPGESGIVAMGTIRQKPWVVDGEVRPRFVTTVGARSTTASSTATA
jgi:pyruvate dehydrogenase E2 component (dihydrolipoamide acetyltransferase)